jgi:CPA2 family monovalent cation:H+ antiporter-2
MADLAITLAKAAAVVAGVLVAARWFVPPVLLRVVRTRSRELFLTLLLVLCLGTAWLTSLAGLSLALGAFLAGLAISESEYSHQALAEAIPFRDAFGSLFFVSIGMLMDVVFVARNLPLVAAVVVAIIVLKTLTAAAPALALGNALHVSLNAGLALAQIGEFAFVLSRVGVELDLIDAVEYQVFLSASVLTMVVTPALLYGGRKLAERAPDKRFETRGAAPLMDDAEHGQINLENHVVIAGYGVNGQNLARALSSAQIPYVVLEMNPETVRTARARGEPLHYGDCTRAAVLEFLGIERARMYVVAISDAASTRQSVSVARSMNPDVYILVRTRFVAEIEELRELGANQVIPEEFETSIEIFARVLHQFEVPRNVILDLVGEVRAGMYGMLRTPESVRGSAAVEMDELLGAEIERFKIKSESPAAGRTLAELELRPRTGASVIAIRRGDAVSTNPEATFRIETGDVLIVLGERAAIDAALALLDPSAAVS